MKQIKKTGDRFVANGGWVVRKLYGRPRTRLFTFLSVGWIVVSAPALFIVLRNSERWRVAPTLSEKIHAVTFEQWIGFLLIVIHLLFATLAVRFHFTEIRREEVFLEDNPNPDPHKFY